MAEEMPTTHNPSSLFERVWNAAPPGTSLVPKRVERYDLNSGLLYAPVEYEYRNFEDISDEPPDITWVENALIDFVRGEFGTGSSRGPCPAQFEPPRLETLGERALYTYLERCESQLVYSGLVDALTRDAGPKMSDHLHALFTNSVLGNRDNVRHLSKDMLANMIDPLIDQQMRLSFIMPAFPFKDQNMFRTMAPPSHVDLGEVAMLVRLHALALAMYQVHPYGADWIIISDGLAYAPILGVNENEVVAYKQRLEDCRNLLGALRDSYR